MDNPTVKDLAKVLDKHEISVEEAAPIMRICAEQMGETLVIEDPKTKDKFKSKFEIEQKLEELNQRMEKHTSSMFSMMDPSVMSIDGQRYILEWVLGQHDSDPTIEEVMDTIPK